ncbi:MAG: TetR/AcrR family transcriptional regulator [Alphaproteobacteria bacterium]
MHAAPAPRPARARRARPPGAVRRETILQAALRRFDAAGYEWTTIRDICQESGASIGSVYHLFDEKQSIAGALYHDGVKGWSEHVAAAVTAAPTTEAAVKGAVHAYLDWATKHPQWFRFLASSRGLANRSSVRRDVDVLLRRFDRVLGAMFARAAAAGEVIAMPDEIYWPLMLGPTYTMMLGRVRVHPATDPPEIWLPGPAEREALAEGAWRSMRR